MDTSPSQAPFTAQSLSVPLVHKVKPPLLNVVAWGLLAWFGGDTNS